MEFSMIHKGFSVQEILVSVMPHNKATQVVVKASMSRELLSSDWQGYFCDCFGGGVLQSQYEWNDRKYEWDYETDEWCFFAYLPTDKVEQYLKNLSKSFYQFHKEQDETAQLTIETIRTLRVEDIVGESSWEVVKTTSRRGSSRGSTERGGGRR